MSNINHQIKFMQGLLDTREENNPVKVKLNRMTQGESDREIASLKEVMESLRAIRDQPKVEAPKEDRPVMGVDKLARLEAAVLEIHKCAKANSEMCPHCKSIADMLGEMGSVTL